MSTGVVATAAVAVVGGLIGVLMLRASYVRLRRGRRTAGTESRSVGALTPDDDRVSVSGTVAKADGRLTAHLADTEGVAVQTEAGRYLERANVDSGPDEGDLERRAEGGSWDYRQTGVRAAPFELADDTGSVRVSPDGGADAVLEPTATADVASASDPSEPVASAVAATDDLLLGSQTERLREGVLAVGDEVTVQGVPTDDGGDLVLSSGEGPLLLSEQGVDEAAEEQAEGWLGYFLLGTLFTVGSGYLAYLVLL